jgi:hypothetical protein
MQAYFEDFIKQVDNGFGLQPANQINLGQPKPSCPVCDQMGEQGHVHKVIVQNNQEGLLISCDGYIVTLPPYVADAIQAFFVTCKVENEGEENGNSNQ